MEKRFLRLPALILLPVYTVFAALTALQAVLNTDAVWQNSLWTDVIEVALHWLEIGGFCVILAFFGAGIYRFTAKNACRSTCSRSGLWFINTRFPSLRCPWRSARLT